jgi:lipoprotein-releasing system permease protein
MSKKSFSLMLAWRYLNPRRAWISSVTMISVAGVLLGVLVLVVVMAVFAGLEREQKRRLLGFSPHVLLQYSTDGVSPSAVTNWNETIDQLIKINGVESATPYIADNAIVDSQGRQQAIFYQAIDTNNVEQVKSIEKMLDFGQYPKSTADMGLDARVVVSSLIAKRFGWSLGDKIQLYSTRNFERVLKDYKSTENLIVRDRFPEEIALVKKFIYEWFENDEGFAAGKGLIKMRDGLIKIYEAESIRDSEKETIAMMLKIIDKAESSESGDSFQFAKGTKKEFEEALQIILTGNQEALDNDVFKNLKGVILPKEVEIIGVFQSSLMVKMPDVFLPLPLAQTISGLEEAVQGVSVRIRDPYEVSKFLPTLTPFLPVNWTTTTWMDQFGDFFKLINQQRVMMYFVLSFIVLISAFSMMAVMFTVTIQKKREIGVMKALGATPWQIMRVFLYQGIILGIVGSAMGVFLGRLVIYFRDELQVVLRSFGFDPFSSDLTGFTTLPAYMNPLEQVCIGLMGLLLCMIASCVPAFFAARSDAAKSLRNI